MVSLLRVSLTARVLECAEVVLYTLINSFKFELSDRPIVWNFAGISYPAISRQNIKSEMYLNVSLAAF